MATIRTLRANLEASGATQFQKDMLASAEAARAAVDATSSATDATEGFGESAETASELGSGFGAVMAQRVARGAAKATGSLVGLVEIGIAQAAAGVSNLGRQLQDRSREMERFQGLVDTTGHALEGLGTTVNKVAHGLTVLRFTIGAAIFGTMAQGVRTANSFEETFNRIETVLPQTGEQLAIIRTRLSELSAETGIAASTVNETFFKAITRMPRLAQDVDKAMRVVRTALEAGSTGFTTATQAIETYEGVLQGFQLEAEDAEQISDKLFKTQELAGVTFDKIAASVGDVASVTNALGGEFNELLAVYATLVPTGQSVSQVTTQLRSVISGIIDPIESARLQARQMGVDMSAAALRSEGLLGVIQNIIKATDGDPELISRLFGRREAVTFLTTIASRMKTVRDRQESIINSTGEHEKTVESMNESISRQADLLKNEWADSIRQLGFTLKEELGDPALNTLKTLNALSDVLTFIGRLELGGFQTLADMTLPTGDPEDVIPRLQEFVAFVRGHRDDVVRERTPSDVFGERGGGMVERLRRLRDEAMQLRSEVTGALPSPAQPMAPQAIVRRMRDEIEIAEARARTFSGAFSEGFDLAAEKARILKNTITTLLEQGLRPSSRLIRRLETRRRLLRMGPIRPQAVGGGLPGRGAVGSVDTLRNATQVAERSVTDLSGVFRNVSSEGADATVVFDGITSALSHLQSVASNTISTIISVASSIANLVSKILQNASTGNIIGAVGGVFGAFAGAFAHGGTIPRNQFGIVGESGPEIVSGPAEVQPMGAPSVSIDLSGARPLTQWVLANDPAFQRLLSDADDVGRQTGRVRI